MLTFRLAFPNTITDELTKRNLFIRIGTNKPVSVDLPNTATLSHPFQGKVGDFVVGTLTDIGHEDETLDVTTFELELQAEPQTLDIYEIGIILDVPDSEDTSLAAV